MEERIWQQYLHTNMSMSFVDFKKEVGYQNTRQAPKKSEEITQAEEIKRLNQAKKRFNFTLKGGNK